MVAESIGGMEFYFRLTLVAMVTKIWDFTSHNEILCDLLQKDWSWTDTVFDRTQNIFRIKQQQCSHKHKHKHGKNIGERTYNVLKFGPKNVSKIHKKLI